MRRGEIPPFGRLVIETTGLADPGPIVATLAADPALRHHVRLGNVVTVVDAVDGARNLEDFPEALKQAAVADRIVVSKTDLAERPAIAALRARLATLNPTAVLHESAADSEAAEALLLHDVHDLASKGEEIRRWLAAETTHAVATTPMTTTVKRAGTATSRPSVSPPPRRSTGPPSASGCRCCSTATDRPSCA